MIIKNFNTTELAKHQDQLFQNYKNLSNNQRKKESKYLQNHTYFKLAKFLAPSNLIIRNYILIDLLNQNHNNYKHVWRLFQKLTGNHSDGLWIEGYTYWIYTKLFLYEYIQNNTNNTIQMKIDHTEKAFQETAYYDSQSNVWKPAPFGDLRKNQIMLNQEKTEENNKKNWSGIPLLKKTYFTTIYYTVLPYIIGFNTHVPDKQRKLFIREGTPLYMENRKPFNFYKGYDKKYKSKIHEIKDTFTWKRFKSLL